MSIPNLKKTVIASIRTHEHTHFYKTIESSRNPYDMKVHILPSWAESYPVNNPNNLIVNRKSQKQPLIT